MATTKSLMTVPKGYRIATVTVNGSPTSALVAKQSRRSKFKMSKSQRDKIAAAARKIKIPVLTIGANAIPAFGALDFLMHDLVAPTTGTEKGVRFFNKVMSPYLPITLQNLGAGQIKANFTPQTILGGTIPNLIVWGVRRSGIFKGTNAKLTKAKLPFSLS